MKAILREKGFVLAAVLSAAVWMPEAQALCDGLPVSGPGSCAPGGPDGTCQGGAGRNVFECALEAGCVMDGVGNDDVLKGAEKGVNVICGGGGNDVLAGGDDDDLLLGQDGNDFAVGFVHTFGGDYIDGGANFDFALGDGFVLPDLVGDTCLNNEVIFTCL